MPGAKQAEGEWAVYDANAYLLDDDGKTKGRTHTVRAGKNYTLYNDKPCWMPEADARSFLKDTAFTVWNEREEVVPSLKQQALDRNQPKKLPPNMVIADLDELTNDALLTRAAQMQGGQVFTQDTRREALVRFLQDGHGAAAAIATPPTRLAAPRMDDAETEEFDPPPLPMGNAKPTPPEHLLEGA